MTEKLTFGEKFGYSLGDMAANFVFQAMMVLQLDFYTHTFGLTPTQVGTLFLVVGLGAACLNPVMGLIADRTNSKWGKFRPWLLWTALPFGIISVLTFTTPHLGAAAKVGYAWVTYCLLRVVYTMNNVPYASLTAVMTDDPDERASIASYRQFAANVAGFIIGTLAIPMVRFLGKGNDPRGYQLTMALVALPSVLFFLLAFLATRERVLPGPHQKNSLRQDLADLIGNGPWMVLFLVTLLYFAAIVIRSNVMLPYFRFVAGNAETFAWFNGFGRAAALVGVACSAAVSARVCKRRVFIVSVVTGGFFSAVLLFISPRATALLIATEVLRQFSFGLSAPILWAMMGDVADYGEWKRGRRASGTVTASVVFALWAGLALGGAIAGGLFSFYGFVSDAQRQTTAAQNGIVLAASLYAAIAFLAAAACMWLYPLTRQLNRQIANELVQRRKSFDAGY